MKMNAKKILTLAIALVMVASLAACGGGNNASSSSSSPSSTPVSPSSESTPSSVPETSSSLPGTSQDAEYDTTAQLYANAITGARDTELNDAYQVFTHDRDLNMSTFRNRYNDMKKEDGSAYTDQEIGTGLDSQSEMLFGLLGFTAADVENYAISISPINTRAYGIAVVKPVAGKEEVVKAGLENFITTQRKNFETYLTDQYEVAKAGYVKTLEDGTMIMVVTEGQDTVFDTISKGLQAK